MTEQVEEKKKRFRSPPYPMFDLGKAVERVESLYSNVQHHTVGVNALAESWNMKSGDGKVWRAAAALIQYGLLSDTGTGKARKFQLTDTAKRIVLDKAPGSERRAAALKEAALKPMIHMELFDQFGTTNGLSDSVLTTYLTIDREEAGDAPYNPNAADEVLRTFRATLAFAGVTDSDSVDAGPGDKEGLEGKVHVPSAQPKFKIGDLVKWTSGGVDQFASRKVNWIDDDEQFLRVIGSNTGIPVSEVTKVAEAQEQTTISPPSPEEVTAENGDLGQDKKKLDVSTSILDGRLQISADVSAEEIDAIIGVLQKYKEILKLMN